MLLISPGSHAYKIITILLITGEFPFRSLGLLGNERMFKEAAVRMTKHQNVRIKGKDKSFRCKLITISGKSTRKTIRLCRSCFPLIEEEFPKMLPRYLEDNYDHHFHGLPRSIERNHRIAETYVMCMRSGIECRYHDVPVLQKEEKRYLTFDNPAFYSSKTIKRLGVDELNKSKYIRMVGAIFSGAGLYEIYNSRSEVLEWYGQGEDKTIQIMSDVCNYNFRIPERHNAIIFGKDYLVAVQTLRRFDLGDKLVRFDYLGYESMHYLPMDESGIKLLQIMMIPDWKNKLLRLIFEEDAIPSVPQFQYDAYVNGTYILSFLDSDILKLSSFCQTVRQEECEWEIACFDTQVDFLKEYLGEEVSLFSIPLNMVHKKLNAGREALI